MNNPLEELTRRELIQLCEELGTKVVDYEVLLDIAQGQNEGFQETIARLYSSLKLAEALLDVADEHNQKYITQVCHLEVELSNIKAIYGL